MAITSDRSIRVQFASDLILDKVFAAAQNTVSIGKCELVALASGANTITVPTSGSNLPKAVTIIPPTGNTTSITFKGVSGDTGVRLHDTDPSSISLHSSVTTFVLTAGGTINNVQLVWS